MKDVRLFSMMIKTYNSTETLYCRNDTRRTSPLSEKKFASPENFFEALRVEDMELTIWSLSKNNP